MAILIKPARWQRVMIKGMYDRVDKMLKEAEITATKDERDALVDLFHDSFCKRTEHITLTREGENICVKLRKDWPDSSYN